MENPNAHEWEPGEIKIGTFSSKASKMQGRDQPGLIVFSNFCVCCIVYFFKGV